MPPKSKLPREEINLLTEWVKRGAPWSKVDETANLAAKEDFDLAKRKSEHWCWQPIRQPTIPIAGWQGHPVDAFLVKRLRDAGLKPAAKADRNTLIRRAYFDLIGLPPSPEEVKVFLADESPDAFAKVVDHLLESPHFGERWARHWLDLVRYAESRGHEFDYGVPNPYHYRDYVIRALNTDVPYDQFVKEHVAGDLLEKPRMNSEDRFNESVLGTGFWFFGEWVHSPVDIRKDETDRFDNMLDVFSKTFLGVTVACARCHDHKFDAISQADYYALAGYLQSSAYRQVRFDTADHNQDVLQQLESARIKAADSYSASLQKGASGTGQQIEAYLSAARQLVDGGAVANEASVAKLASEKQLQTKMLSAWTSELQRAAKDNQHPFHWWMSLKDAASVKPVLDRWTNDRKPGRHLGRTQNSSSATTT